MSIVFVQVRVERHQLNLRTPTVWGLDDHRTFAYFAVKRSIVDLMLAASRYAIAHRRWRQTNVDLDGTVLILQWSAADADLRIGLERNDHVEIPSVVAKNGVDLQKTVDDVCARGTRARERTCSLLLI